MSMLLATPPVTSGSVSSPTQAISSGWARRALVRASAKEPEVHLYYVASEDVYLCVVTAPADGDERFIVTAYFTKNIKKGNELWTK